ncbi:hypothetical protein N0V91_002142 [Didymella pomorum]|uniref:Uncharacterized protein n=1 Tax=Didymella pomorum TaxID=749634 RepID=A0A9W8ZLL4_9PLEO|nr:hypothetical protein N0V91_002142 [Didymella pomorum]
MATMDENVHGSQLWSASNATIRAGLDSIWHTDFLLPLATSILVPAVVFLIEVLHHLIYRALRRLRTMQEGNTNPFPFESLPQELRDMVYKNLLEDVSYPTTAAPQPTSSLNSMFSGIWGAATSTRPTQTRKPSSWIFLANKQIYAEYMDIFSKHSTFTLTVSPSNYQPNSLDPRLWTISASTLSQIRTAHLDLVITSAMLGSPDPRLMSTSSWALASQIRSEISKMTNCTHLTLSSKAIGDPLWNPLWIWYHTSQSFKSIGTQLSDCTQGPKLDQIRFSLDTWSPGENYLKRDEGNEGGWTWFCLEGHAVGFDGGMEQTVREFCGMLYRECRTCRPAEEGEEEEDQE